MGNPPEAGQQLPPSAAEHGVAPMRRDIEQRLEYERPAMHLGVGQNQTGPADGRLAPGDPPAPIGDQVEVERTGRMTCPYPPPCQPFEALQLRQQPCGRQ